MKRAAVIIIGIGLVILGSKLIIKDKFGDSIAPVSYTHLGQLRRGKPCRNENRS